MGTGPIRCVAIAVAVAALLVVACSPAPAPTPSSPGPAASAAGPAPSGTAASPSPAPSSVPASVSPGGSLASDGSIVVLGNDYSLSVVEADRSSTLLSPRSPGIVAFPAWSPDGSRIASIRTIGSDNAVVVFDADARSGDRAEAVPIFQDPDSGPFYVSWTPDGERVSFLANDAGGGLSLRIAPADGSAPLDGSDPASTIRSGNPLYFDWIEDDRLLAHVGAGPEALLGEIGLDGEAVGPSLEAPGDFRSAAVSPDGESVGFVRLGEGGTSEVVVAARDGSDERSMPLFGKGALGFDPTGDTLAAIGFTEPAPVAYTVPLGPLRLLDRGSGDVRTLLDGAVVTFWWSPDGRAIAALRVQPAESPVASGNPSPSASATPTVGPSPSTGAASDEVRLLFVDVASGEVESESVVQPGRLFVDQLLPYFDQYALSHRLWAPDSASLLLPVVGEDGQTRVAVVPRDGDPASTIDGVMAFWSP